LQREPEYGRLDLEARIPRGAAGGKRIGHEPQAANDFDLRGAARKSAGRLRVRDREIAREELRVDARPRGCDTPPIVPRMSPRMSVWNGNG
jgi:hypothetical protein